MSSVILTGDTSGTLTVSAPLVAGSNTLTLAAATGTLSPLVSATAVTASGTSVDFTGIPSWAKRITVMFSGVSTNGTSIPIIQLGDAGGIENTGYVGGAGSSGGNTSQTTGIPITNANAAADVCTGNVIISSLGSNIWVANGSFYSGSLARTCGSAKTLSDVLTQVRITTVNGTDTFDAGTINIIYEG